jgi:hypothetical protein
MDPTMQEATTNCVDSEGRFCSLFNMVSAASTTFPASRSLIALNNAIQFLSVVENNRVQGPHSNFFQTAFISFGLK